MHRNEIKHSLPTWAYQAKEKLSVIRQGGSVEALNSTDRKVWRAVSPIQAAALGN